MKRWMKILSAVAVIVVGLVVAGVAVLANMDFNQYKGLIAEKVQEATGRELQINGDLKLAISLVPAVEVNDVKFANAEWGSQPQMATIQHFEAQVSLLPLLSQQVVINKLVLENVELLAETDAQGQANWEFATAAEKPAQPAPESGEPAAIPAIEEVLLRNVRLTYRDGATGETQRVNIESLSATTPAPGDRVEVKLLAQLNDEELEVTGELGSIQQMAVPDEVFPANVKLTGLGATVAFDGELGMPGGKPAIVGKLAVNGNSLRDTFARAATLAPALKGTEVPDPGKYDLSAQVDMRNDTAKLTGLSARLGDSDLKGDLTAALGGKTPNIEAKLSSDQVDLTQLLPKTEEAPEEKGDKDRVFPDEPLPLEGLKAADATLDYQAGKIVAPGLTVTEVALNMVLKGGRLDVKKLEASSYDGKLAANALVDASQATPAVNLAAKLDGLDFGKLLKDQEMTEMASGTVNGEVDVKGSGTSVRRIMAGLGGHTRFVVPSGKLDSNILNIATADVASALPFLGKSTDDKAIRCAVADFRIKDGLAAVKALVFETGSISAVGVGDINLKDETLNLAIDPSTKKQSLASMALTPVKVGGTLANPSVSPDPAALAGTVAGTAARVGGAVATMGLSLLAERVVNEAKDKVVDTTDYCAQALAGKQVVPGGGGGGDTSSSSGSGSGDGGQQQGGGGNPVEELGKGLKGLFGN